MADQIVEIIDLIDENKDFDVKIDNKKDFELIEIVSDEDEVQEITKHPTGTYYQRAFRSIALSVKEVYASILNPNEQDILELISSDLSVQAERLFIRLILRKAGWIRCQKLEYEDIPEITGALEELNTKKLVSIDSDDLDDYLNILTMPELKSFASQKLHLNLSNLNSLQRDDLIRSIQSTKSGGQQRICFSSDGKLSTSLHQNNSKLKSLQQFCGPIVKINDEIRDLIDSCISLYFLVSGSSQENLSTAILVEINRRSYPKYEVLRESPIFNSRNDYLEYKKALELEMALKDSDSSVALESWSEVEKRFVSFTDACAAEGSYFLRRYTAGWVYCRILSHIATVLESLKRHVEAVKVYNQLLNQRLFCLGYRGKWWERIVLDTSKHLKDPKSAFEYCEEAFNDCYLRTSALTSIRRRSKKLKKAIEEESSSNGNFENLEEIEEPEVITIKGRIQGGNQTGKKVKLHINGDDLLTGTVEEFVLNEFSRDGWEGVHSESSCFTTLFGLIFWDLLFNVRVPDVFQTAYQTAPLDLTTDAFYPMRKDALEARLQLIQEDFGEAMRLLKRHHVANHLVSCVGVNWSSYFGEAGIEMLVKVCEGVGCVALSIIMRQFCEDYRHNRSGMPDLILWRSDEDDDVRRSELVEFANRLIFAEVKSPNDRLSDGQRHWFSVLKNSGLRVVVVRVLQEDEIE